MEKFDPKAPSKGLGDTIAKLTHAVGLDKLAEILAQAAGAEDCGCNERRHIVNDWYPYTTEGSSPPPPPHINTQPLDENVGNYLVLQEINITLPEIGPFTFTKGTELPITKEHPLYNDVPFYYKENIIKKLNN